MDKINFDFIDITIPDFDPDFFCAWILSVAEEENVNIDWLQYIFCSDDEIIKINKEALDHDFYTDIITFNFNEENSCAGDLFISYDRVKDNAIKFGDGNIYNELCRVMVHGVLHLVGYNDKTESEIETMRAKEKYYLGKRDDVSRETSVKKK